MADAEILARGVELPPGSGGMIRHALRRIGDGWHGPVELIEITRLIDAGRSGAVVIEVALRAGDEYRQRVVKIGPADEMATEYSRFHRFLAQYPATVCAPIQEATPGAVDPAAQRGGEVEAVVYTHVTDYAGRPRTPACTLEDLVRAAFAGRPRVRDVRQVIEQLFTKMATPFHNRRTVREQRSLRDLNPSLGADLVLSPAPVRAEPIYFEDVLDASLGTGEFSPGQELRIADSGGDEIRVEVLGDREGAGFAGHVVRSRFPEQRRKLDGAFAAVDRDGGSVVADGVKTADPAAGLRPVLTDPRFGRVRGVVHGDLNARNVMCVENQPILIDFAKTADDRPVLSDAAWLEISLLRDVFADLPYADLVRIQRFLALATRFRPLVADVAELEAAFDGLLEGSALVAFRILHEVRAQAQHAFPVADAWLDYLAQLHLSAYRTVKWEAQSGPALRAVHAAAAVATEWLATEDPYAYWTGLPDLLGRLSPLVDLTRPDAVAAVTGLLTAVDSRHPGAEVPGADELRNQFVRTWYVEHARELVVSLSHEHGPFHETRRVPHGETTVLAGGPGAGKSRLLRELAYRGALAIAGPGRSERSLRVPFRVTAAELPADLPRELLVLGAVHLLLDGLDELSREDRDRVAAWCRSLLDRFPRVRLTVATRNSTWAADAFGIPVTELGSWHTLDVVQFLGWFSFSDRLVGEMTTKIMELHRADGGAPPGFVTMVAETVRTAGWPVSIDDVYEKYFADGLTGEAVAVLASLAATAVDAGGAVQPSADVGAFVDRGILTHSGDGVRFDRLAVRDFFAARALSTARELVPRRARSFAWYDICLVAARLPSTPDAVVELMARSVATADPCHAARLLSFRPAIALRYLPVWQAVLADPDAGSYSHRRAAEALLLTAVSPAWRALGDILLDPGAPATTQAEILDVLEQHLSPAQDDSAFALWARGTLGAILTGDHATGTKIAAIAVIGSSGLPGLEIILADLLQSGAAQVAGAADDVLHSFDVLMPRYLDGVRAALTTARLAEVEARLPALSGAARIRAANDLRLRLLKRTKAVPKLLRGLYSYGVSLDVHFAVRDLLRGTGYGAAAKVSEIAELPEAEAMALAYRVLSTGPEDPDALVFAARADSPLHLLLIAAAAVRSPAAADHAAKLVAELAPVVAADRIEGLAALGQAVHDVDRRRGFVVTRRAARVLRDRDLAARRHWPWSTMLAHTSPAPGELDQFLAEGVEGALGELAGYAPSWDGLRPVPRIGEAAREFVLGKSHDDDTEWVLAAAAAGLTDALPLILEVAGKRPLATDVETISTGRYGIVEMAPHAWVLAALGGLARESGEPTAAHRLIDEFDTEGLHPSVGTGRLTGLALLGDWEPLLLAAPGDGGPLDTAARQAIQFWVPGPCTPAGLRDPEDVAARLLRLAAEPGIAPERRSLLEELIHYAEQSLGRLLPR